MVQQFPGADNFFHLLIFFPPIETGLQIRGGAQHWSIVSNIDSGLSQAGYTKVRKWLACARGQFKPKMPGFYFGPGPGLSEPKSKPISAMSLRLCHFSAAICSTDKQAIYYPVKCAGAPKHFSRQPALQVSLKAQGPGSEIIEI